MLTIASFPGPSHKSNSHESNFSRPSYKSNSYGKNFSVSSHESNFVGKAVDHGGWARAPTTFELICENFLPSGASMFTQSQRVV